MFLKLCNIIWTPCGIGAQKTCGMMTYSYLPISLLLYSSMFHWITIEQHTLSKSFMRIIQD